METHLTAREIFIRTANVYLEDKNLIIRTDVSGDNDQCFYQVIAYLVFGDENRYNNQRILKLLYLGYQGCQTLPLIYVIQ